MKMNVLLLPYVAPQSYIVEMEMEGIVAYSSNGNVPDMPGEDLSYGLQDKKDNRINA